MSRIINYKKALRLFLGLALFLLALSQLDCVRILQHLEDCRIEYLLGSLLITMASIGFRLVIRHHLLHIFVKTPFSVILKTFLTTSYLTNMLPARLGGLLGEPWGLYSFSQKRVSLQNALAFCLVTTSAQNIRKIILTLAGLFCLAATLPMAYNLVIAAAVILYTGYTSAVLYAVFSFENVPASLARWKRWIPEKFASFFLAIGSLGKEAAAGIRFFFSRRRPVLINLSLLLIISTLLESLRLWVLLLAFGVHFNFLYLLLIPSLAYAVTALPVSLGGFGITEVSGLIVFKSFGIQPEIALSVVFLDRILSTYWNFVVGAFLIPFIRLPGREDFSTEKINALEPLD